MEALLRGERSNEKGDNTKYSAPFKNQLTIQEKERKVLNQKGKTTKEG